MIQRRHFLRGAGALACSAAAHPFLTTVTLAASDGGRPLGDHRLVVILLRGAMDGLDVVQPQGDRGFAALRPTLNRPDALPLDGFFALNPALGGLMPLWQAGQLGFVHATSTPYRDKRSHFDGQDQLEAGTGNDLALASVRDGWLNRLLQAVPGVRAETAYAVGREEMRILSGPAQVRDWAPDTRLDLSPQARRLLEQVYHDDPAFLAVANEAMELGIDLDAEPAGMQAPMPELAGARLADVEELVGFVTARLRAETRIAAFSLNGWDTHKAQKTGIGRSLSRLERAILRLSQRLGPEIWGKTVVLAMTEFGRTAAENGSGGTDHGTAGAMLLAGGAVRGGKIWGDWPGLDEADLYDRRDLLPTSDVRVWAAHVIAGLYGIDRATLESAIFPGMQMGQVPGLIL
ncbi:DUF1501 domain-containing protein [Fuscibacter oryzae]|nr:DUF1501 domain-containing protein [Fuscibacter oryzae]